MTNEVKNYSIFKLACPIFIQMLLSMCLRYVDTIMVSQYSEIAVGALGNANQIFGFLSLAFTIISSATGVAVAQYLGAKKTDEMDKIYTVAVFFNLSLSLLVCLVVTTFSKQLLMAINVPEVMLKDANDYMKIVGYFLFTDAVVMIFSHVFNCHGKTHIGMLIFFGMNVFNVCGNYMFLFGPLSYLNLGVKGVAISTTCSSILGMVTAFVLFKVIVKGRISIKLLSPFPREIFIKLIRLGIPTAGENISYNIAQIIITAIVNSLGPEAITAKICCNTLMLFSLVYSNSIAGATAIVVGHSVGAGDYEFASKRVLKSLTSAMLISIVVALTNFYLSKWTIPFFSNNEEIIKIGRNIMFIGIFLEIGRCINLVVIQSMRSAGDVVFPTVLGICSMWGISVVFAWILGIKFSLGLKGIFIAMAADEIIRGIVVYIRWQMGTWKGKSIVAKDNK